MKQSDVRYISATKVGFYKVEMTYNEEKASASPIPDMLMYLVQTDKFNHVYTVESTTRPAHKYDNSVPAALWHSLTVVLLADFLTITEVMDSMLRDKIIESYSLTSEDHYNSISV